MLQTPDGHSRIELARFQSPPSPDGDAVVARLRARGAELVGDLERYGHSYRLCDVRGPEGIIVELAEGVG